MNTIFWEEGGRVGVINHEMRFIKKKSGFFFTEKLLIYF